MNADDSTAILSEKAVLGSIVLDNALMGEAAESLMPADFYLQSHRLIYSAMLELYERQEPIEYGSIYLLLQERGQVQSAGGAIAIAALGDGIARTDSLGYYAAQMKKKSAVRDLARAANLIVEKCLEQPDEPELIAECQKIFWDACEVHTSSGFVPLGEAAMKYLQEIEALDSGSDDVVGLKTGFRELDFRLLGLQRTDLIIVAARPSVGKTTLAFNVAMNAAKAGKRVGFFSIEMKDVRIGEKAVSLSGRIDSSRLRVGRLDSSTWTRLFDLGAGMMELPFQICDTSSITSLEIRAKAERLKRQMGLDLVVIDYLQNMARDKRIGKYEGVGENVQEIKALAKDLNVPILLLSQLSREIENRGVGSEPQLSDLGESGEIERAADVIIFLYHDQETLANGRMVNVKVGKNRTGATGVFRLFYDKPINFFGNLER